jgi:hypothetical protein
MEAIQVFLANASPPSEGELGNSLNFTIFFPLSACFWVTNLWDTLIMMTAMMLE